MDDRADFPKTEDAFLAFVRTFLRSHPEKFGARHIDPGASLRIDACHAKRRDGDGAVLGWVVTVQIDPRLGVPISDPTAEPTWGSSTVLVLHLDEHGELLGERSQ